MKEFEKVEDYLQMLALHFEVKSKETAEKGKTVPTSILYLLQSQKTYNFLMFFERWAEAGFIDEFENEATAE